MIVFGGNDCFSTNFGDVWILSNANGLGGTPTWMQLAPSGTSPVSRSQLGAVYDRVSNRMVIFGGEQNGSPVYLNDVWVLSNANGLGGTPAWTQLSPSGTPPSGRTGHTAVYDGTNNRMTIFGGGNGSGPLGDAWVLSDANGVGGTPSWTQLGPFTVFPEGRVLHTAVYDASRNEMTVFGGYSGFGVTNDVWVLRGANGL